MDVIIELVLIFLSVMEILGYLISVDFFIFFFYIFAVKFVCFSRALHIPDTQFSFFWHQGVFINFIYLIIAEFIKIVMKENYVFFFLFKFFSTVMHFYRCVFFLKLLNLINRRKLKEYTQRKRDVRIEFSCKY